MMKDIPVTFEFKGKQYKGHLTKVMGAGSNAHFHLMVDGYYWGQFFNTENYGWQLHGNDDGLQELRDYFEMVVTSHYQ